MPSYRDDTNELIFDGDIERFAFHFWEENGLWHYGESGSNNKRSTELSTPDFDIALRWLIYNVAGSARHRLRFHPLRIPIDGALDHENIATGWSIQLDDDLIGQLITPDGKVLDMQMQVSTRRAAQLVILSHLMAYTPEQLLTSYMDPYGRPHLTQYLHEDPALTRIGKPSHPIPPLETANWGKSPGHVSRARSATS
ncbi:Imm61 family immunity protein [Schaalia sp. Marseille-Q2122]|uniref:Imm61 family immunity protein n=1 Tax=Schaalia sp. Marseille-Q2122 TaxID=2736604 RepID=UPI00158F3851|nr:Imm61 family immunity protein [Schaalia sp. Marseille-Q2122]